MPGAGVGAARLCLLALALPGWTARGSGEGGVPPPQELVIPQWKPAEPESLVREKHPRHAELRVKAEGQELVLDLEKNEFLFTEAYTETHYTAPGRPAHRTLRSENHCFYHGTVRKVALSSVALSTCRGIRGLITLSGNLSYVLEPIPGLGRQHRLYRLEHLPLPTGSCGLPHSPAHMPGAPHWPLHFPNHTQPRPRRMKRDELKNTKFVELYLVADYAEFQKNRYDPDATKHKLMEIANYVDKFYRSLNIRIALVGLEVWTHGDLCEVSSNPYSTLWSFLSWRRKLLARKKHDNAQLITAVPFQGTTIGLAPLMAMCSVYQSGGVSMDYSENAIGVAATMAHEIGHNFGMNHDSEHCCLAKAEDGGCIMAAATGHPFPRVFNDCNRRDLERYLLSGGGMCLSNMPDTSTMYGGRRCGNGYLEEGEECDCGEEQECKNPCCNADNCTLRPGAQCAHGACCQNCRLLAPGTPCRSSAQQCDLPEFCTGVSPHCPTNFYQMDGTPCEGGQAYCYNGMCLTYQQQCQQLWGPGAQPSPDLCFESVNVAGDTFGNCGKDMNGMYRKCSLSDTKCGKIQCHSSETRPLESNTVAIETKVTIDGRRIICKGTFVYRTPEEESDMLDPGLVMTGTKCGHNHICFEGQCRNTSFFHREGCEWQCHGHGVCNNNGNCHCDRGWAPPYCDTPGYGGSVDSGPLPAQVTQTGWEDPWGQQSHALWFPRGVYPETRRQHAWRSRRGRDLHRRLPAGRPAAGPSLLSPQPQAGPDGALDTPCHAAAALPLSLQGVSEQRVGPRQPNFQASDPPEQEEGDQHPRNPAEAHPAASATPSRLPALRRTLDPTTLAPQQTGQGIPRGWGGRGEEGVSPGASPKPARAPRPTLSPHSGLLQTAATPKGASGQPSAWPQEPAPASWRPRPAAPGQRPDPKASRVQIAQGHRHG